MIIHNIIHALILNGFEQNTQFQSFLSDQLLWNGSRFDFLKTVGQLSRDQCLIRNAIRSKKCYKERKKNRIKFTITMEIILLHCIAFLSVALLAQANRTNVWLK